jgi:hypothetical protein
MKRFMCVLLLAGCSMASCKKAIEKVLTAAPQKNAEGYTAYIIRKGNHSAEGNHYRSLLTDHLKFRVLFDSSCIYTTSREWNTADVNKLYGFSDCNTGHHVNSARFGWRWSGQALEILAYCYVNGERQSKLLGTIPIGQPVDMSIRLQESEYIFELNGQSFRMPRYCATSRAEGYQLYPYFGGDETAPHDVKILVRDL